MNDIEKLLTKKELESLKAVIVDGDDEGFFDSGIYDKLFEYFCNSGEMPYGTAKARTGDPVEWILERLQGMDLFKGGGKG